MAYIGRKTEYGILYGGGNGPVEVLGPGTSGYLLATSGTGSAPRWVPAPASGAGLTRHAQSIPSTDTSGTGTALDRTGNPTYYVVATTDGSGHRDGWTSKGLLPDTAHMTAGQIIRVKWVTQATTAPLEILASNSGTIDGIASITFDSNYQSFTFVYSGTAQAWEVI